MTAQLDGRPLDPNRPFARLQRGEHQVIVEAEDTRQWVQDWLDWAGLTAEELLDRHERRDFEGMKDGHAWAACGAELEGGWYVLPPDTAR